MITLIPGRLSISFIHRCLKRYPNRGPWPFRYCILAFLLASRQIDRRITLGPPARFKKLVQGKRVCVVGPSRGVLRNPPGLIDSYDLVVRLNSGWPVSPERQDRVGKRCDIWYHVCNRFGKLGDIANNKDFASIRYARLMPVIYRTNIDRSLSHLGRNRQSSLPSSHYENKYLTLYRACKQHGVPVDDFHHTKSMRYLKRINEKLSHITTTGFFSICELLDCDIAELYITGLTFNCENDLPDYPTSKNGIRVRQGAESFHNQDRLFEIFKRIQIRDKRVRVDTTLEDIIRLDSLGRVEHYVPQTSMVGKEQKSLCSQEEG